jgi:hypothetical protein
MVAQVTGPDDELDERVNGDVDGGVGEEAEVTFEADDDDLEHGGADDEW